MSNSSTNLRRSTRLKAIAESTNTENELRRSSRSIRKQHESSTDSDSDVPTMRIEMENDLANIEKEILKPTELSCSETVSGQTLYKFQAVSKKNGMLQKVNSCQTPNSSKTPRKVPVLKVVLEKVDTSKINLKKVRKHKEQTDPKEHRMRRRSPPTLTESESESVSEGSDYKPSDETDNESKESTIDTDSDVEDEYSDADDITESLRATNIKSPKKAIHTPRRLKKNHKSSFAYKEYHIKTDEYFETQAERTVTSDHTLGKLLGSRLTEEKLGQLLANQSHVSETHRKSIRSLSENSMALFPMWHFILEEGYSLLLHGLGSKRNLINDFYKDVIKDHPTLIVNGFFPSLTVKDILDGIITDLLGLSCPTNPNDCCDLIEKTLRNNPKDRLYLLIHNIDGVMLRSQKTQDILSCLAAIPNLHLLASVDHINVPLLWDNVKRSKYNFYWWDATTLLPYQAEISYESSLLVQQSGALALSSLRNVFLSLTSNARSIYVLLAKYQLENGNNNNFTGMAFKDLYRAAREGFLVSSDIALRAQLTEFIDHKLVRTKRNIDGSEYLIIPLNNSLLKQFLEQHEP